MIDANIIIQEENEVNIVTTKGDDVNLVIKNGNEIKLIIQNEDEIKIVTQQNNETTALVGQTIPIKGDKGEPGATPDLSSYAKKTDLSAEISRAGTVESSIQASLDNKADSSNLNNYVPTTRKVNNKPLSSDITLTNSDIGLGNVPNIDCTTTVNISDSTDKRFITDAQKTIVSNTSNTNTGDETEATIITKLGYDPLVISIALGW